MSWILGFVGSRITPGIRQVLGGVQDTPLTVVARDSLHVAVGGLSRRGSDPAGWSVAVESLVR